MTTLRGGLCAPRVDPPADEVGRLVEFLNGQSRIRMAAWLGHDHQGDVDEHLLLGIDARDWDESDLRALDQGLEHDVIGFQAWLDVFSVADADAVRETGVVLWEQTSPGADPLDYRLTFEPLETDAETLEQFRARLRAVPEIQRVGARLRKLWKGGVVLEESVELAVDAPPPANVLNVAADAARETVVAGWASWSSAIGRPSAESVIYER